MSEETNFAFDVFLSHSSKVKPIVRELAARLKKDGLRVWFDEEQIRPGDSVPAKIEDGLERSRVLVLCGTARMIPVILPDVKETPELPLFVRQTLWVDMRAWEEDEGDGFYRLVCGILGRAPGDAPMKRFGVRDVAEWQGTNW